ncbi:MAG: PepSY domain-containing protein [Steroidobacteraceae bacterium]|nr:PepSY domain-containing protein [Steroidobacteraceae bacterium]MCW5572976.1 PepSY domain-containing protein [Steroidobacteraceae bacterium]
MKIRADVLRTYTDVHTWVGIVGGLALFVAFYAGAITMFEEPLRRWASPPVALPAAVALERAPELIDAVLERHPEAARAYAVHYRIDPDTPARVSWEDEADVRYGAAFDAHGQLVTARTDEAPVAQLIDVLHQQVGLPFEHEISMPIMGVIALLYGVALVSGVIVLLPTLVQDLFAWRLGRNLKRLWLDVHNALGVFSLPFHVVMALTAVVFAFHDGFYATQNALIYEHRLDSMWGREPSQAAPDAELLTPQQLAARMAQQAPGFTPVAVEFRQNPAGVTTARVIGYDAREMMRAPTYGLASLDPYTGRFTDTAYLPGHQPGWEKLVTSFFTLHFGSFGGAPVRWGYFLLGLAGAFLFYSGNLIWVEARRRRQRRQDGGVLPPQKRSSRVMAALTVGVCLGCVSGISVTIAAAKWLPGRVQDLEAAHTYIYYAVFLACTGWALLRGAARAAFELLMLSAGATLLIPATSLAAALFAAAPGWNWPGTARLVDVVAFAGALLFVALAVRTRRRTLHGDADSVWSLSRPDPSSAPAGARAPHASV